MPYLTPDEIPEATYCRSLLIPDSPDWLAIVSGAINELGQEWNWEKQGSVTPAEASQAMLQMWLAFVESACAPASCGKIVRRGIGGVWEESTDGGETWEPPSGSETVPPQTARTEPTSDERRCLAAANAANVLQLTYEGMIDAWQTDQSITFGQSALVSLLTGAIGNWLGLIAGAAVSLAWEVFGLAYAALSFLLQDSWTETFTDDLQCILFNLSSDNAGVVSFDYEGLVNHCVNNIIGTDVNTSRLWSQIWYMLQWIGADGLNRAGETTAITTADCVACNSWSYWVPLDRLAESSLFTELTYPSNSCATPWNPTPMARVQPVDYYGGRAELLSTYVSAIARLAFRLTIPIPENTHITWIQANYRPIVISVDPIERFLLNGTQVGGCGANQTWAGDLSNQTITIDLGGTGSGNATSIWSCYRILFQGTGYNPFLDWLGEGLVNP